MFGSSGFTFGSSNQQQQQQQQQQPNQGFGSTAGTSGFGGFGGAQQATGNAQQPSFGFGSTASTAVNSGFGASATAPTGFGQNPTQNTGFGASATGSSGFGAGGSFGQQTSSFGQPAQSVGGFGQTFGASQNTFGAANTSSGFGAPAAPGFGSAFGQQKPAGFGFGASSTTAPAPSAFGASTFGGASTATSNQPTSASVNNGTGNPSWAVTVEREQATISVLSNFNAISAMPAYKNWSIEELRAQDYAMNKKFANSQPTAPTAFGATSTTTAAPSTFGAFGQPQQQSTGLFGQPAQPATTAFGQPTQQATSAFGQPAAQTTGFGFGQKPATTGFGQPTTTAFGQPAQTTGGLFGQPAQPATAAFGQPTQQATSTFGQPAAQSTGFGFGQKPATLAFGQPSGTTAQPGGLFGATNTPAAPTTGFGATTFGAAPATTPATTSFGFGQQQPKPSTGSAFGAPAPAAGGGLFGQQQQQQKPLFGAPTAAPTTGFGFGSTTQQQQPASTIGGTTGLFGNTTTAGAPSTLNAPTGGLFGQQSIQQPAQSGGLFGGGAFGQKPATGFGGAATTPATSGFSFGNQSQGQGGAVTGGSLFGGLGTSTNNAPLGGGGLLGSGLGGGSLGFSSSIGAQSQGPALHASLDKNPYGINPLLQKSGASTSTNTADSKVPINATASSSAEKKLPTLTPTFKVTPRSTSQIKLRGVAPPSSGPSLAESHRNQIGASNKKSLHVLDGSPRDVVALGLDSRFTPRRSVKRLDIDDASVFLGTPGSTNGGAGKTNDSASRSVLLDPSLEDTAASLMQGGTQPSIIGTPLVSRTVSPSPRSSGLNGSRSVSASPGSPPRQAHQYVMSPSVDELLRLSDKELGAVSHFSVSIPLYGSVSFLEPVDLLAASPTGTRSGIQEIPGKIVIISSQLVTVYPDDNVKHPRGEGLNVPAVISLASCWPKDKKSGEIIDNESDPRFDKHLKKLRSMPDTTFIGFEVVSGTWKFRVEHFSRYGLVSDDEDDEGGFDVDMHTVPETPGAAVVKRHVQFEGQEEDDDYSIVDDTFMKQATPSDTKHKWSTLKKSPLGMKYDDDVIEDSEDSDEEEEEFDQEVENEEYEEELESEDDEQDYEQVFEDDEQDEQDDEQDDEQVSSETSSESSGGSLSEEIDLVDTIPRNTLNDSMPTITRIQTARNVQTMKSVLFPSTTPTKTVQPSKPISFSFNQNGVEKNQVVSKRPSEMDVDEGDAMVPGVVSRTEFSSLPIVSQSPHKYLRQGNLIISKVNLRQAVPYNESIAYEQHKVNAGDAAFFMGRAFRAGFGPNGKFISLKSMATVSINTVNVVSNESLGLESCDSTMDCVFDNCKMVVTELAKDGSMDEIQLDTNAKSLSHQCPKAIMNTDFSFDKLFSVKCLQHEASIWKLCSSLWDELDINVTELCDLTQEQVEIIDEALRKQKVSDWLKNAVQDDVLKSLAHEESDISRILLNLTGNRLAEALKLALKSKSFRLATVLSQLACPVAVKTPTGILSPNGFPGRGGLSPQVAADLISQVDEWKGSDMDENYLAVWSLISGGIHHWTEAVLSPLFDWKRTFGLFLWYSQGGRISLQEAAEQYSANLEDIVKPTSPYSTSFYDLEYHIIQLMVDSKAKLEDALNPLTHTKNQLDYRVSWLIGMCLSKIKTVQQFQDVVFYEIEDDDCKIDESEPLVFGFSYTQETLLIHFISQLETIGLWKWAIFASTFLSSHNQREGMIRRILTRSYPYEEASGSFIYSDSPSEDYVFLTEKLKVPPVWIHEARALKALYHNDLHQHIVALLDANQVHLAHRLILAKYAPSCLLDNKRKELSGLLNYLSKSKSLLSEWERGGGVLLAYLELLDHFPQDDSPIPSLWGPEKVESAFKTCSGLLKIISQDISSTWKSVGVSVSCDECELDLLTISIQEMTMYLSSLSTHLNGLKIDAGMLSLLPLVSNDRSTFVKDLAMQFMLST